MKDEITQVLEDRKNDFYPSNEKAFDKLKCKELHIGQKISWYYEDDLEYAKEWQDEGFNIRDDPGFSGIIATFNDITLPSNDKTNLDTDDCFVIVTEYPCEKEYCLSGWVYLNRLLDREDLVEVF